MPNLIAMVVALCMVFSGGYAAPAGEVSSLTCRVSDVWLSLGDETVELDGLAGRLGFQSDGESGLADFALELDGTPMVPVQVGADPEKGLFVTLVKSGRSYIFADIEALETIAGTELSALEAADLGIAEVAEAGRLLTLMRADMLSGGLRTFTRGYAEALSRMDRGAPARETVTRRETDHAVDAYRYEISAEEEGRAAREAAAYLRESGEYALFSEIIETEGVEYTGLRIEEYIAPDGSFYELTEYMGQTPLETLTFIGDELRCTFSGELDYGSHKEDMTFDITAGPDCLRGTVKSVQPSGTVLEMMFDLDIAPVSGDVTGPLDIVYIDDAVGGEIRAAVDFDRGGGIAAGVRVGDVMAGAYFEFSDEPIEDRSLAAKIIPVEDESDMLSMGVALMGMELEVQTIVRSAPMLALNEMMDRWLYADPEDDTHMGWTDGTAHIIFSPGDILDLTLSRHTAGKGDLPMLAPAGYEQELRAANRSLGVVYAVLEGDRGGMTVGYADNGEIAAAALLRPELLTGPVIIRQDGGTWITAAADTRLVNFRADHTLDDDEVRALLAEAGF